MLKRLRGPGAAIAAGGPAMVPDPPVSGPGDLIRAACENARALVRICDVLGSGPAQVDRDGHELVSDGAWILPEE